MSTPRPSKIVAAGAIGNAIEWFDFAVYGYFAAIIGKQFFPAADPTASVLAAFAVFASGFLVRPVGAAFFGHIGDRWGRVAALRLSVVLMAVSTGLLGLLPTYASIGLAAPIAMVILRMGQGFSVGGEYTSSIVFLVERAPVGQRGWIGSWASFSGVGGFLLGAGTAALLANVLTSAALESWGWRLPFLAGTGVALVARYFRRGLEDAYQGAADEHLPLAQALRTEWRAMLHITGLVVSTYMAFSMMFIYITTFLTRQLGVPEGESLTLDTVGMSLLVTLIPFGGWLSDRIGRRPVMLYGCVGVLLLSFPLVHLLAADAAWRILLGQFGFALLIGPALGVVPVALVEVTRSSYRCTVVSLGYNITLAVFGGTAPLLAAWLLSETHNPLALAGLMSTAALVSTITLLLTTEPAGRSLKA